MAEKLTSKEIDDLIINLIGEEVLPLAAQLKNKTNVSEFKLAESLNITVNQVRNMLYRMHQHNLVTFIRKKDKKKGWYIYYWTMNYNYMREAMVNFMKHKLDDFKQKLEKEMCGNYFICPNKCSRIALEQALEQEFHCQECGELMQQQDNSRTIDNLKSMIGGLEEEIRIHSPKPAEKKAVSMPGVKKPAKPAAKKAIKGKKAAARKPKRKIAKKKIVKKAAKKPKPIKPKIKKILVKRKKSLIKKKFSLVKKFLKKRR